MAIIWHIRMWVQRGKLLGKALLQPAAVGAVLRRDNYLKRIQPQTLCIGFVVSVVVIHDDAWYRRDDSADNEGKR